MYAYNSERTTRWQGLNIEVQIRSELQHQWATAVETVGAFTGNDLKSNVGDPTWLRFFALMSTAIAQREGTPEVPETPTNPRELVEEIEECDRILGVSGRLAAFQHLTRRLQALRRISNHWVVLELNLETQPRHGPCLQSERAGGRDVSVSRQGTGEPGTSTNRGGVGLREFAVRTQKGVPELLRGPWRISGACFWRSSRIGDDRFFQAGLPPYLRFPLAVHDGLHDALEFLRRRFADLRPSFCIDHIRFPLQLTPASESTTGTRCP